ncbi:MAG: class I SAM-dependent methyltransferase [Gemmatimonadaceae bacterium]|nr:class I SAM-dependent methyltransferase [Gemmatimonadaceae bacterium]
MVLKPQRPASLLTSIRCTGTGTGQAALGLITHFGQVVATDASLRQLARARRDATISYVAAAAERMPFQSASVDLITVARALHWLDVERFSEERHLRRATPFNPTLCTAEPGASTESVNARTG